MESKIRAAGTSELIATDSLAKSLRRRIDRDGAMSFADFMHAALYDPEHGFYMQANPPYRDYFTSARVHAGLFGAMLARHLDDVWEALERPRPFRVVELGCGDGGLARQVLEVAAHHPWADDLTYAGVEISPTRRARAASVAAAARFVSDAHDLDAGNAVAILSNELFDAFPVALLRRTADGWVEECVQTTDEGFAFSDRPAAGAARAYAERYGSNVPAGGRIESRTGVREIYHAIVGLGRPIVMTSIDFGGLADELHGKRLRAGTLLAYRRHTASEDVLERPGGSDLAAHVNFSELMDAGQEVGLEATRLGTQADLLSALGIGEYLVHLQSRSGITSEAYAQAREAVFQLTAPGELGRFRVLVQGYGTDLSGIRGVDDFAGAGAPPQKGN